MSHHIFESAARRAGALRVLGRGGSVVAGECRLASCRVRRFCCWLASWPIPSTNCSLPGSLWSARGHDTGRRVGFCSGPSRRASADRTLPAVFSIRAESLARGERLFDRYGSVTVFLARFIFGMRVLASLLAGALHMPWRKFVLYNFLGAAVWVSAICGAGYLFGGHWGRLVHDLKRFDLVVAIVVVVAGALLWWWRSRGRPDLS